jgi:hypothetical protein
MRQLLVLLGVALVAVAAYFVLRSKETVSLETTASSISNSETGLIVGVESDKGILIGYAKVGSHSGIAPAKIAGGTLIVDEVRTPLALGSDGRWTAAVPRWTSGTHDVRVEVQEVGVTQLRYWEAKGIE